MFTRPNGLSDSDVAAAVVMAWPMYVDRLEYAPVGFGSHHWHAVAGPDRWFITVDDLDARLRDESDSRPAAGDRLIAALETATALVDNGLDFVVAPQPSLAGRVLEPIDGRFVVAVYSIVEGRSGAPHAGYPDAYDRMTVVDRLAQLHAAEAEALPALRDDLSIPRRRELEQSLTELDRSWSAGTFGEQARQLLSQHLGPLEDVLALFDRLVGELRSDTRLVVTHGEPHPGNVIFIRRGRPRFVDWDTALLAHPERDLWRLIGEDADVRSHYESRSGRQLSDTALTAYRLWWDLCEIALYTHGFRQPHGATADTRTAWQGFVDHLDPERWRDVLEGNGDACGEV